MMKITRIAALLAAILLLCSGCSMDVENFLQPPAAQGEQKPIQNALETYINDSGDANRRYTLQYPSEGEFTSAFVTCDERGVPIDEDDSQQPPSPSLAVAFYLFSGANEEVHINLLRRDGEDWISVADVSGFGSDILQVAFGDLDGDGMQELIAGFGTYNSRDHRLAVLSMVNGLTVLDDGQMYTRLFVGQMAADHDSLLTMRIGEANTVSATLSSLRDGRLVPLGKVSLDGYIQQFGNMSYSRLGNGLSGLYIDGVKSGGTLVTELIYYDGERLCAPFYDADTNTTPATARHSGLTVRDIDGDGTAEIPQCTLFAGYDESAELPSAAWLTDWMRYDIVSGTLHTHLSTVVNTDDGYFVTLSDTQRQQWTAVYDIRTGTLTLQDIESGDTYMRLVPYTDEPPYEYHVLFVASESTAGVAVQYDEDVLNMQKVRYMVSRLV